MNADTSPEALDRLIALLNLAEEDPDVIHEREECYHLPKLAADTIAALRALTADAGAQGEAGLIRDQFTVTRHGFGAGGKPVSASAEVEHHYMLADVAPPADPVREAARVRVKALEWESIGGDYACRAQTGFAGVSYRIEKSWDAFVIVFSVPGMELGIVGKFPKLEAAKAAAQADYEARILAALEGDK